MADNTAVLKLKAHELISLLAKKGVEANEMPESIREYSIKLNLVRGGSIQIYYSPKRVQFKIEPQNIFDPQLEILVRAVLKTEHQEDNDLEQVGNGAISIYVDGSYISESVGYGAVAVGNGEIIWKTSGKVQKEQAGSSRQVAGELQAVLNSLEWCESQGITSISIHYDYEGIEKWVTGEWKAKHTVSKAYLTAVTQSQVDISWVKVKAHSGNKWNDIADELAKSGAKLNELSDTIEDLQSQFEMLLSEVIDFLRSQGIESKKKQSQSQQYYHVQIKIWNKMEDLGFLNVYGTPKKGAYVGFHEVKSGFNATLSKAWSERQSTAIDPLSEVEYYYSALVVFRGLRFDFQILAEAIAEKWIEKFNQDFNVEQKRYNFDALEEAIGHLRKAHKGGTGDIHA
jgi:ribonuclease H-related protein